MNLLEMMRHEVSQFKLVDELEIAYYLYMRTGELFEYNPFYFFLPLKEKIKYKSQEMNIKEIQNYEIICFEWADIMEELCKCFGLNAKKIIIEKEGNSHAYIELTIKNEKYKLDLTAYYEDITLIKLGLGVKRFSKLISGQIFFEYNKTKIETIEEKFYEKGIKSNHIKKIVAQKRRNLLILKQKLYEKAGKNVGEEEYIYQVYRVIGDIIHNFANNLGYISGAKSISYLLDCFINDYTSNTSYFYDNEQKVYIRVDSVKHNGQISYFAYQKMLDGSYEFQEVPKIYIESLKAMYSSEFAENLVFEKPSYVLNSNNVCYQR